MAIVQSAICCWTSRPIPMARSHIRSKPRLAHLTSSERCTLRLWFSSASGDWIDLSAQGASGSHSQGQRPWEYSQRTIPRAEGPAVRLLCSVSRVNCRPVGACVEQEPIPQAVGLGSTNYWPFWAEERQPWQLPCFEQTASCTPDLDRRNSAMAFGRKVVTIPALVPFGNAIGHAQNQWFPCGA